MNLQDWQAATSPQIEYVVDESEGVKLFNTLVPELEVYVHGICLEVAKLLYKKSEEVPHFGKLTFRVEAGEFVAWKDGEPPHITVCVSSDYLVKYNTQGGDIKEEVRGILFHELTHAYQHSNGQELYSIEGVADLVRYLAGYIPLELRQVGGNYTSSYKIGGFFYDWIRAMYQSRGDFLYELNQSAHPNNGGVWSFEEVIKQFTGKQVALLWTEYQQELEVKGINCITSRVTN